MNNLIPTKNTLTLPKGDVASAKQWLEGAALCEAGKVYCQVMAGFELAVLWKQAGIKNGGDHCSAEAKALSQNEKLLTHDKICEELGESTAQVYRYMSMAKFCATRLKRMPALADFNPLITPIATLPQPKADALRAVVHKLTDGKTQKEFGEKCGLWKKPQGAGATGRDKGEGGRKKLTLSEQAEAQKLLAVEDWRGMETAFTAYGAKFTLLPDDAVTAQIATLEQHLTARKAWLKQPLNQRDPKAVEGLLL